jgi:phd_YefM
MRVISSSELRNNMKKYLDLAIEEKIVIQRGRNETFVLTREEYLEPDEDLKRAISGEELLVGVEADIREAFRKRHNA